MSKRSFDQMQAQLMNKLHVHLTLEPKKLIQSVLLPQTPHFSQVSWKYSSVHVSNSCLRTKSRMCHGHFPLFWLLQPHNPPQFLSTIFHGGNFQDSSLIHTWKQPWSISGWNKMLCPGARGPQGTMGWHRRSSQWLTGRARWTWLETPAWEGCARGKRETSMRKEIPGSTTINLFLYENWNNTTRYSLILSSVFDSVGLIAKCAGVKKWVSRFLFAKGQSFKDYGEMGAISISFICQARKRKLFLICQTLREVECSVSESHNFYSLFPSTLNSGLLFIQKL